MAQDRCELSQSDMAERRWAACEGSSSMTVLKSGNQSRDRGTTSQEKVLHNPNRMLSEGQGIWLPAVEVRGEADCDKVKG